MMTDQADPPLRPEPGAPGSRRAASLGCLCSGRRYAWGGYELADACPLHGLGASDAARLLWSIPTTATLPSGDWD